GNPQQIANEDIRSDALITLAEAAQLIPGATASTLKRKARAGKLVVYRLGKSYCTTVADVQRMIQTCRVAPKVQDCGVNLPTAIAPPIGSSAMVHACAALDSALAQVSGKRTRR